VAPLDAAQGHKLTGDGGADGLGQDAVPLAWGQPPAVIGVAINKNFCLLFGWYSRRCNILAYRFGQKSAKRFGVVLMAEFEIE